MNKYVLYSIDKTIVIYVISILYIYSKWKANEQNEREWRKKELVIMETFSKLNANMEKVCR